MKTYIITPHIQSFFDKTTSTWTYIIYAKDHPDKRCAIIDSVLDYDINSSRTSMESINPVIDFIQSNNLEVQWILETHPHADHITGAYHLKEKLGGKTGIGEHIKKVLTVWENIFHNEDDTPKDGSQFDHLFIDGEEFFIGPIKTKVIHTPGHTPADISYVIGDSIFTGDALFLPDVGSGRCDFLGGNAHDSYDSIHKILSFPDEYKVYVGHDYPPNERKREECMATVRDQKEHNIRIYNSITKEKFVEKRINDDKKKAVPALLFPSIQTNLRAGSFGKRNQGMCYIKLPINAI